MVFHYASIVHNEYLHSLKTIMWMLMKVICTCRARHYLPKLTGIVLPYKWLPGKCIDTLEASIIVPLSMQPVSGRFGWCELAGVHAQNKYWRNHIFTQAIDYGGQCVPMIDWLLSKESLHTSIYLYTYISRL